MTDKQNNRFNDCSCNCPTPDLAPIRNPNCNDCDKSKDLPMPESFFEWVKLLTPIQKNQLPPFDVRITKLPYNEKGIITLSDKEIIQYEYSKETIYQKDGNGVNIPYSKNVPWKPWVITIVKRGLHPAGTFSGLNGNGSNYVDKREGSEIVRYTADYNNCEFMYDHGTNSDVSIDITHLQIRMASALTCCRPASNTDLGTVVVEWPICTGHEQYPNVPSMCLIANCGKAGIVRDVTKCMPEGQEKLVSYNDYATPTRPGLVQIMGYTDVNCTTWAKTVHTPTGEIPEVALNAAQKAYADVYGAVTLSINGSDGKAHSSNHHANSTTAGIILTRPIEQIYYDMPNSIPRNGNPMTSCWNTPVRAVTDYDLADIGVNGLVKLSRPCDGDTTKNIALNKYDTATVTNIWSTMLSRDPCASCAPRAVGDNDPRLFMPYLEYYNSQVGWGAEPEVKRTTSGTTEAIFSYKQTNITPGGVALNCWVRNSLYYWMQKSAEELFLNNRRLIVPKTGQYLVSFEVRMFIDPGADSTIPLGISQARVVRNGVNTTIGDKKEWLHRNWLIDLNNFNNAQNGSKSRTWTNIWPLSVNWQLCGSDSFMTAAHNWWLNEWDEIYVTMDLDTNTALDYMYYRQRLSLFFLDETAMF